MQPAPPTSLTTTTMASSPRPLYPPLPCGLLIQCNPKPAYPELDPKDLEGRKAPSVKLTHCINYKHFDEAGPAQEKFEEVWKVFADLSENNKKILLDGVLGLCNWPLLTYTSNLLKPLMRVDFIAELPDSIAWKIFSYLDAKSLCQASKVSKRWKHIAEDEVLWFRMCDTHTGKICPNCGWGLPALEPSPTHPNKKLQRSYKELFEERLQVARNWRKPKYQLKELRGHTDGIMCVQSDSQKVLSGSYDRTIRIWNIETGEPLAVLEGHTSAVRGLQFDEEKVISCSMDSTIKIWCMRTQKCLRTLVGHNSGVLCINYDKTRLVSGSADHTIKVWNILKAECYTLCGHTDRVNAVVLLDDFLLSASDDSTVKYWDLRTRQCLYTFTEHTAPVQSLQVLGDKFATSSLDSTIKIWDLKTRTCHKTLFGHVDGVWCARFDAIRAVSGSHDKTVKVWNINDAAVVATLTHTKEVNCLSLSDSRIITGSEDGVVRIFDFGLYNNVS